MNDLFKEALKFLHPDEEFFGLCLVIVGIILSIFFKYYSFNKRDYANKFLITWVCVMVVIGCYVRINRYSIEKAKIFPRGSDGIIVTWLEGDKGEIRKKLINDLAGKLETDLAPIIRTHG